MADAFNQEDEYVEVNGERKPYYSTRYGSLRTLFSQFREEGIVPLSLAVILERRAHSSAPGWLESSLDSCTSIVYPAKGAYAEQERRFKVCSVSERVLALKRDTPLIQGALPLESYESVRGQEFLRKKVILGKDLKEEEAREHPVLLSFCQGDRSLLQAVVEKDFSEARRREFNDKHMGLYLGDELSIPSERAFYVYWLDDYWGSGADGNSDLNGGIGQLVGIAPGALVRLEKRLRDEKRIHVDFVGALGEERVTPKERIIESRYDIGLAEGEQQYFGEAEVDEAFQFARESGQKDPQKVIEVARQRLLSRRREHES